MFLICRILELPFTKRFLHPSNSEQVAATDAVVSSSPPPIISESEDTLNLTLDLKEMAKQTMKRHIRLMEQALNRLDSTESYEFFNNEVRKMDNTLEKFIPYQGPSKQR